MSGFPTFEHWTLFKDHLYRMSGFDKINLFPLHVPNVCVIVNVKCLIGPSRPVYHLEEQKQECLSEASCDVSKVNVSKLHRWTYWPEK